MAGTAKASAQSAERRRERRRAASEARAVARPRAGARRKAWLRRSSAIASTHDGDARPRARADVEPAERGEHVVAEPPAPIIEAMITMLSESMITWLTPTISGAPAAGSMTCQVSWRGVQPAMRPNSTISGGTPRSASSVTRTIGGMA